jgi:hypothetical protein
MKNKPVVFAALYFMTLPGWSAYDAFQDKLQRPSTEKRDLKQATQPTPEGLQSGEIKSYRDTLKSVRTQMFKDGAMPKGATLRADDKNNPTSFQIQAPYNQLSKTAQTQVAAKMPEAQNVPTPLVITVALDHDVTRVDSVAVATPRSSSSPLAASIAKPSAARGAIAAPSATPARPNVGASFRTERVARDSSEPAAPRAALKTGRETPSPSNTMTLSDAGKLFLGKDAASVQVLSGPIAVARTPATRALLPLSSRESITVTQVQLEPESIGLRVTAVMPSASVPAPIIERLTEDKPEALSLVSAEKNVQMGIEVTPDSGFKIVTIRPLADTEPATPPAETPADVRSALTDLNAAAPAVPKASAVSGSGFLKGAQLLANALGIAPESIVFETPSADPQATPIGPLAIVTHTNGNAVLVEPVKLPAVGAGYLIQGRVGNFSNTLQAEIKSRLDVGGEDFLPGNPELIIESKAGPESGFDVQSIALAPTETSLSIVLWKADPARDVASAPERGALRSMPVRLIGAAGAARALVKTVFGEKSDKITFDVAAPVPTVRFTASDNANLSVRWNATDRDDRQSFLFVGKPLEFTDAIRAAIAADLPEPTKKASPDVQVEFLVDQSKPTPEVKVIEAGPSPRELAKRQARALGLSPRDYLLVDIGSRFLIVVDRGQSLLAPGVNVRLKSPDGMLTVVANPRQAKADTAVLFIFSRLGIKANWANLVRLAGGNIDETMDKTLRDNPGSDQFLIRVTPSQPSSFIVRALNPNTAALLKPGTSKP